MINAWTKFINLAYAHPTWFIYTQGQFWYSVLVVACIFLSVCVCVSVSVSTSSLCMWWLITHSSKDKKIKQKM